MAQEEKLEEAKRLYKMANANERYMLESLFPELKELGDERVRKELIDYINRLTVTPNNIDRYNSWVTWLEKQGKEECALKSSKDEDVRKFMQYIEKEAKAYEFNLPNRSYDIYAFAKDILYWLEKQGERKTVDKVKPNFKIGDYIKHNKANLICKVISVNSGSYYVENIKTNGRIELFNAEQNFHLWTIADAKEGDVLWHSDSASNGIFIFKEIRHDGKVLCYCDYDSEDHFCNGEYHTCCWSNDKYIKPATKEQRDHLFEKIHEAGYVWDEEKKEVKKIEWNNIVRDSIFDEEIDIPFGAIDSELYYQEIYIPDGFQATIEGRKIILKKEE